MDSPQVALVERRFGDLSDIEYQVFTCDIGGERTANALVLRFKGSYGYGSAGNGDAAFMRTITLCSLSLWDVEAVVFDLRELNYEWGDSIWSMYGLGVQPSGVGDLPYATVVSDRCRTGFKSCESIVGPLFDDIESAIEDVRPRAQAYLSALWADEG